MAAYVILTATRSDPILGRCYGFQKQSAVCVSKREEDKIAAMRMCT